MNENKLAQKMELIFCESSDGILSELRNGNYAEDKEKISEAMEIATEINQKIKKESLSSQEIAYAMTFIYYMRGYEDCAYWIENFVESFYNKCLEGVKY